MDGQMVGSAPRYTASGPVGFDRIEMGGLAVSEESAQWDDIEIGLLPEGGTVQPVSSIGVAQTMADGIWVSLPPMVIDVVGPGWFHVQAPYPATPTSPPTPAGGMRCFYTIGASNPGLQPGDEVAVTGQLETIGCERALNALNPVLLARNQPYNPAVWATQKTFRMPNPSMTGLHVATWGDVIDSGDFTTYFVIDDHSDPNNTSGIKVYSTNPQNIFTFVTVQGILGCENGQPVIYTSNTSDVTVQN